MVNFFKYQGTGNDFVIVDDRSKTFPVSQGLISKICSRRFGIGADGLILLQNHSEFDFQMIYFNSDGAESSMCGNGGRCIVAFAKHLGIINEKTNFLAIDGAHEAVINDEVVSLKMSDVLEVEEGDDYYYLNTGSPHYVSFTDDVAQLSLVEDARKIRYNSRFKLEGTNVNYVASLNDGIKVRTYERGVEDETLSCGTGVTACAIASFLKINNDQDQWTVETEGGELEVSFDVVNTSFTNIWLTGKAVLVYKGMYAL